MNADHTTRDVHLPETEWDGAAYDRLSGPQARWGRAVLDRLELHGNETVLDVGCGSGRVTEELLGRLASGRVVALDASVSMLAEAQRRLAAHSGQVRFVRADLLAGVSGIERDGPAFVQVNRGM